MGVGKVPTVWDGKIAGIWLALDALLLSPVLVFSDLMIAMSAVYKVAATETARSENLRTVVDAIWEWQGAGPQFHLR